ncbi:MAG: FAD-dependent oxidoreductase [Candidatus Heimdallarchaeaceae archaeon]
MIIGGGIAGISAALKIADSGNQVYLVEKEPSIGGRMSQLDKTFPTLDCAACILSPKMVSVGKHPNIELLAYSELVDVEGYIGNFKVKIKKKAKSVDEEKCTSCGDCWENCLLGKLPGSLQSIYRPIRNISSTQGGRHFFSR